ncbi:hypothetical protein OKW49_001776 [Paraburkholderia youngii]
MHRNEFRLRMAACTTTADVIYTDKPNVFAVSASTRRARLSWAGAYREALSSASDYCARRGTACRPARNSISYAADMNWKSGEQSWPSSAVEVKLFLTNDGRHDKRHDLSYCRRASSFTDAIVDHIFPGHHDDPIDLVGHVSYASPLNEHVVVMGVAKNSPHPESKSGEVLIRSHPIDVDRIVRHSHR